MLYIIFLLNIIFVLSVFYLKRYMINFIELQFQKDKSYESEKGKNLATKEDIKEITANIETVKNEISFEKQRSHDFIKEREQRFLNILFHAETITNSVNRLYVYGHNNQDATRVHTLIDEISKAALLMRQESSVCIAAYNVATNIAGYKYMFDKAQSQDEQARYDTLQKVMMIGLQNNNLLEAPLQYKDVVNEDINQYLLWLNRLYVNGLAINYKIELITAINVN